MEQEHFTVKEWPDQERPRERLIRNGAKTLTDAELLGIILVKGLKGKSSIEIAKTLLSKTRTLRRLDDLSFSEMTAIRGIGSAKFAQIKAALEIGKRLFQESSPIMKKIYNARDVADYYRAHMRDLKKEVFILILLDIKNKIMKDVTISEGSLTESLVHPREVLNEIVRESAASVIFLHNHPSGESKPSEKDLEITKRLVDACKIIGVKVLDHIIIGDESFTSFIQEGLI